jgi:hypothetical protein
VNSGNLKVKSRRRFGKTWRRLVAF